MFSKLLVASDLTGASAHAVQLALALAAQHKASVTLLHVIEKPSQAHHWLVPPFEDELRIYRIAVRREEQEAYRRLAEQARQAGAPGVHAEAIVRNGRAAESIVAVAAEIGAELVVVGTHGREGTLGSVAERIVRSARRPVLVVPANQELAKPGLTVEHERRNDHGEHHSQE
jgi:nucleotide-binding universal stress UspA family protein